jgi:hypothetical protein
MMIVLARQLIHVVLTNLKQNDNNKYYDCNKI